MQQIGGDLMLRDETPADRQFALALYAEARAAEIAAMPWTPLERLRFLAGQFAAQEAHYRANEPAADRWIVTRGDEPVGRLYVARGRGWWRLLEIGLTPAAQGGGIGTALTASPTA